MITEPKNTKERKQFFLTLLEECKKENVYSVIETAEKLGIDYEQVQEWSNKNKKLKQILEECRSTCLYNVNTTMEDESLDFREYGRLNMYIFENDDNENAKWEASKEASRLEREALKQKEELEKQKAKELRNPNRIALAQYCTNVLPETYFPSDSESKDTKLITTNNNTIAQWEQNRDSAQKERLDKWREKLAKETCNYAIEKNSEKSTKDVNHIEPDFIDSNLTPLQKENILKADLCAATGTASYRLGAAILTQTVSACFRNGYENIGIPTTITQEALIAMKPADAFEGMLCGRLIALDNQIMTFMARASFIDQTQEFMDLNLNRAAKLTRLFNETLETLNRHRRKGEQKVTVQHVTVGSGGQAIVTGELTRGGDDNKK